MNTPEDFDEIDVTEDEFDAMMATAEPVAIFAAALARRPRTAFADYYTLTVSDPSTVPSSDRWGNGLQGRPVMLAPVTSAS